MTELRYGPAPTTSAQPWRVAVVAIASLVGAPAGVVAGFVAVVMWSGCFISCSGPNHGAGALLGALGVLLLLAGPLLAWVLLRRWSAVGLSMLGIVGSLLVCVVLFGVI